MVADIINDNYTFIKTIPRSASLGPISSLALKGLADSPKSLPYFLLYDDTGSEIFEDITALEEYYLTNCERNILQNQSDDIVHQSSPFTVLVELGSGSSYKTTSVINAMLKRLQEYDTERGKKTMTRMTYVPIDISGAILDSSSKLLLKDLNNPRLDILAVNGFYKDGMEAVWRMFPNEKKLVIWLGSSIGNLEDTEAVTFMQEIREAISQEDRFLVGMDLMKDSKILKAAYDDSLGVTAKFTVNILQRLNTELKGDYFDMNKFKHHVIVNTELDQVEIYLQCLESHSVSIDSMDLKFTKGELIKIERCCKYTFAKIDKYAKLSGFKLDKRWLDSKEMFSLNMFAPSPSHQLVANSGQPTCSPNEIEKIVSNGWQCSDKVFSLLSSPQDYFTKPIDLRNPFIFYVGHLTAFYHSHILTHSLKLPSFNSVYERIFQRGIDPSVDDPSVCHSHSEIPDSWPSLNEVTNYKNEVRRRVLASLSQFTSRLDAKRVANLCAEHELMHSETLLYMLMEMNPSKLALDVLGNSPRESLSKNSNLDLTKMITIPSGTAFMGASFDSIDFGWDNEFPKTTDTVEEFKISEYPITNEQFKEFVASGNYNNPKYWKTSDWTWKQSIQLDFPHMWTRNNSGEFSQRTLWGSIPLEQVKNWPVYVSWSEANAYATWKGARLPTEPEFNRAAYKSESAQYPWGDAEPVPGVHGNFGFNRWNPTDVDAHPKGASSHGVKDLVGNGWEWTSTLFAPYPGFIPHIPHYPGYSSDFFDYNHYVMLGASWATTGSLIRKSFRNWFQPHYVYMFSKFRIVSCSS